MLLSAMTLMSFFSLKHRLLDAASPDLGLFRTRGLALGTVFDIAESFLIAYVHIPFGTC